MTDMGIAFIPPVAPRRPKRAQPDTSRYVSAAQAAALLGGTPSKRTIQRELSRATLSASGRVLEGPWQGSVLANGRWKVARACVERMQAAGAPVHRETPEARLLREHSARLSQVEKQLEAVILGLHLAGAMVAGEIDTDRLLRDAQAMREAEREERA